MEQSTIVAIILAAATIIAGWAYLKSDVKGILDWIDKHVKECKARSDKEETRRLKEEDLRTAMLDKEIVRRDKEEDRREEIAKMLEELRIEGIRQGTLVDVHHRSIQINDEEIKKLREKVHELGNLIHNRMHKSS